MSATLKAGTQLRLQAAIPQAVLIANTSLELVSPKDGYITSLRATVQDTVTTGGTLTVLVGDAATPVAGLSMVVANGAAKGSRPAMAAPSVGTQSRKVSAGDRIQIKPTSFATAGSLLVVLSIEDIDTDPQLPPLQPNG